jgi:S1-C subfamily serine protease
MKRASKGESMSERFRYRRVSIITVLAVVSLWAGSGQARSHPEGRAGVPAMIARVLPAVVSITTRQIERDQFNQPVPTRGLGSGVIIDRRGYILTNSHVVADALEIKVTLTDERSFKGTLVGADPFTDLAVVRIDGKRLPIASLGDSARLAVGETVVAMGNPLWIEGGPTVTVGVVSALGRSMEQPGLPLLHDLIQTDAAINAGNSGGPLVNRAGRVVGINTAVIASAHGIGFAISVNTAKPVLAALIASGRVVRPSVGLEAVSVTPQVAYANDLPMERGALVIRVDPDGPAAAAGLQPGDVITAVNGRAVRDLHQFHDSLTRYRAGQTVSVTLARDGRTLTPRLVLENDR